MSLNELIEQARALPQAEIKQLMRALIDLLPDDKPTPPAEHSILELAGLGEEIWRGIDPGEYIEQLREEWDERA
jgi:hypothetical protein